LKNLGVLACSARTSGAKGPMETTVRFSAWNRSRNTLPWSSNCSGNLVYLEGMGIHWANEKRCRWTCGSSLSSPSQQNRTCRNSSCFLHAFRRPILNSFQTSLVFCNSTFDRAKCRNIAPPCLGKRSHSPLDKAVSPNPRRWTQLGLPLPPICMFAQPLRNQQILSIAWATSFEMDSRRCRFKSVKLILRHLTNWWSVWMDWMVHLCLHQLLSPGRTAPTFNSGTPSIPYLAPSSLNVLSRWP